MTFTGVSGNKCGVWFFVDVFKNKKTLLSLRTLSYYYQLAVRLFGLLLNCMCVDILHGNVLPIHVCSLCTIFPPNFSGSICSFGIVDIQALIS